MIISDYVIVRITKNNIDYYSNKNYDISKSQIKVKVEDLCDTSKSLIKVKCDSCGRIFSVKWEKYLNNKASQCNVDYCNECLCDYNNCDNNNINKVSEEIPFIAIKKYYEDNDCTLLLEEEDYKYGQKTIAPYICSCGRVQEGRSIYYFKHKNKMCAECAKEEKRKNKAYSLKRDYQSVKEQMLSDDKQLLTQKDYFTKNDDIEYRCLICGTVNKIKFYTYTSGEHMCKMCRLINIRKQRWEYILSLAKCSDAMILTPFVDYVDDSTRIVVRCSCNKLFTTTVNEFVYDSKRQCNECGIMMKSGDKSTLWKGGITSEYERIRKSKQYIHWKNNVFSRDNYTCQCCGGILNGSLNAHHINNFSDHEDLRFNISNGITLCNFCHNPNQKGSFHNIYGTHNNTKEQLQEYLNNRRIGFQLPAIYIDEIIN